MIRLRLSTLLLLTLLFALPAMAEQANPCLSQCLNPMLQRSLEASISGLRLERAVKEGALALALVDITEPGSPRLAAVNANRMMYAASLPKIAILLGAFEKASRGQLELDSGTIDKLTQMIRHSSNQAATEMLNRVGKPYLASVLRSPKYRLYDPAQNGGLWVGKDYGKRPAWKRDPLHNLSHGATPLQVARFYYMLEMGQLVSQRASRTMKTILGNPAIHHKFVKGLEAARPGSRIYRKSGTWRTYHSDSAIVERNGRRYIAVALANDRNGGEWLKRLIVAMDDVIFGHSTPSKLVSRLHAAQQ
jgi:beta-lactamase class A